MTLSVSLVFLGGVWQGKRGSNLGFSEILQPILHQVGSEPQRKQWVVSSMGPTFLCLCEGGWHLLNLIPVLALWGADF